LLAWPWPSIIESLRLEKNSKIIRSNRQTITAMPPKPCPEVPYHFEHLHDSPTFSSHLCWPPTWQQQATHLSRSFCFRSPNSSSRIHAQDNPVTLRINLDSAAELQQAAWTGLEERSPNRYLVSRR